MRFIRWLCKNCGAGNDPFIVGAKCRLCGS